MERETITVHEFIEKHGLTMTAEPAASNPNADADQWSKEASHWLCTIRKPGMVGKRDGFQVPFSQGAAFRQWKSGIRFSPAGFTEHDRERYGYKPGKRVGQAILSQNTLWSEAVIRDCTEPTPPDLATVLDCLASDAGGYDNSRDFEDWAGEYGYDTDSRKAERTYRVIAEQAKGLRYFLGDDAYRELMDAERL